MALLPAVAALGALALLAGALVFFLGSAPAAAPSRGTATAALVQSLQRTLATSTLEVKAVLATPAYFRATAQEDVGRRYGASRDVVLLLSEDVHFGDLGEPLRPVLVVDDRAYAPTRVDVVMDATHHRASAVVYADPERALVDPSIDVVELLLPGLSGQALRWEHPFGEVRASAPPLSFPAFLALLGGVLASMWPCLFQLSAYFLPSVAGLSLDEAQRARWRLPVVRTAILFVSGIVVVYTLAGAAAGFAAQSLASTALFEAARRPLMIVAGLAILAMALRLAVRARAPLVCTMPVVSLAGRGRTGPLGTAALGLAFATGCMTCFGAAVVLGMFAYVVNAASPLAGAVLLFLFSLGIAVPLVLAAVAMSRVLPLLFRFERAARALSLGSVAIMALYAVLLLTDSAHVASDALAAAFGAAR